MIKLDVEFERECSQCYGHGYLLSVAEDRKPCEQCRGTGRTATELGVELLEFLEHQGIKPASVEQGKESQ